MIMRDTNLTTRIKKELIDFCTEHNPNNILYEDWSSNIVYSVLLDAIDINSIELFYYFTPRFPMDDFYRIYLTCIITACNTEKFEFVRHILELGFPVDMINTDDPILECINNITNQFSFESKGYTKISIPVGQEITCIFCRGETNGEDIYVHKCQFDNDNKLRTYNNVFHKSCIESYLGTNRKCPLCRQFGSKKRRNSKKQRNSKKRRRSPKKQKN